MLAMALCISGDFSLAIVGISVCIFGHFYFAENKPVLLEQENVSPFLAITQGETDIRTSCRNNGGTKEKRHENKSDQNFSSHTRLLLPGFSYRRLYL